MESAKLPEGIIKGYLGKFLSLYCIAGATFMEVTVGAQPLADLQWKKRVLIIFSPRDTNVDFIAQRLTLSRNREGLKDRDVVTLMFVKGELDVNNTTGMPTINALSIKKSFNISDEKFTILLIGKDGDVKLRRNSRINLCDLFTLIDLMPMRQNEINLQGTSVACLP